MNETNTPETLAYADRIEAAAEREARAREQAAADYALKRGEDIHAALAAPARNCDRFDDPGKAWLAYKAECDKNETVPNMIGAISWLFAPAEGGAE